LVGLTVSRQPLVAARGLGPRRDARDTAQQESRCQRASQRGIADRPILLRTLVLRTVQKTAPRVASRAASVTTRPDSEPFGICVVVGTCQHKIYCLHLLLHLIFWLHAILTCTKFPNDPKNLASGDRGGHHKELDARVVRSHFYIAFRFARTSQ